MKAASWTVAALVLIVVLIGVVSATAVVGINVASASDVSSGAAHAIAVTRAQLQLERATSAARGYVLFGEARYQDRLKSASTSLAATLARLRSELRSSGDSEIVDEVVDEVDAAVAAYEEALRQASAQRDDTSPAAARAFLENDAQPRREEVADALSRLGSLVNADLDVALRVAASDQRRALALVTVVAAGALLLASILAVSVGRAGRLLEKQRIELDLSNGRLRDRNADLDAFAGRVAHDLRNSLSPLVLLTRSLAPAGLTSQAQIELAQRLDRIVHRTTMLLDGLLAFSRAGRADEGPTSSAVETICDVVDDLKPFASAIDASVEVVAEAGIDGRRVRCSAALLHVVATNLVQNALKFLSPDAKGAVRIGLATTDDRLRLTIEDTGPGIPDDALPHIFDPFFRVAGVQAAGTGLGLATVKRIVDAHGGAIRVHSTLGRGSEFEVLLPLVPVAA